MEATVMRVRNLETQFHTDNGVVRAVNDISFDLAPHERLAVVGESGSGKSAMALSLLRLISYPGRIEGGSVEFGGEDLLSLPEADMNRIRGGAIGMVFQDPMTALDPVMRVCDQMVAPIRRHLRLTRSAARNVAVDLLRKVGIPEPERRIDHYPFELSGGMRQRVIIAIAISCNPRLIIADEPTTALDVTIQAQIVQLLREITEQSGSAMLFITHDMGLVARFAQTVAVMYAGKIVEYGDVRDVFARPQHPYTQSLLRTIPSVTGPRLERLAQIDGFPPDMRIPITGCAFADRCPLAFDRCRAEAPELHEHATRHLSSCWRLEPSGGSHHDNGAAPPDRPAPQAGQRSAQLEPAQPGSAHQGSAQPGSVLGTAGSRAMSGQFAARPDSAPHQILHVQRLRKEFPARGRRTWKAGNPIQAVNGIDIVLHRGETLGLVGESGCGKSTTARLLLNLEEPTSGDIAVSDRRIDHPSGAELVRYRQRVQMIFQDPYSSFNPRMRIGSIITEPMDVMHIGNPAERREKAIALIERVGLDQSYLSRFPSQLSGGQRQRVAIARALALSPSVIVADEPTSALDVSVRAQVINLLSDLKRELGLSLIFISHDLSTVRHISDTLAVMYLGEIMETGPSESIFSEPAHPYTTALLEAVPVADPLIEEHRRSTVLKGDLPSPSNPPSGCVFSTRCPLATDHCRSVKPELRRHAERKVACHYVE